MPISDPTEVTPFNDFRNSGIRTSDTLNAWRKKENGLVDLIDRWVINSTDIQVGVDASNPLTSRISIVDGAVGTTKLANGAVTEPKIAAGSVNGSKIVANSIITTHIQAGAVTGTQIANRTISKDKIVLYSISNEELATNSVRSENIQNGSIGTSHIVDGSVTTPKIFSGAVTTDKIGASSVTTVKIADSNVTTIKLADSAVTTAKIFSGAITDTKIANNAVTSTKIADNSINRTKIASGSGNFPVQVKQKIWSTPSTVTLPVGVWVDVPGLTETITVKAGSNVRIQATIRGTPTRANPGYSTTFYLFRNGVIVKSLNPALSSTDAQAFINWSNYLVGEATIDYLDIHDPVLTGEATHTYTVRAMLPYNSDAFYYNRSYYDASQLTLRGHTFSILTLTELA